MPTVGGEVYFEGPYEQSCLVNAMALGLCERERLVRSAAAGPGNAIVLFGASTGRDGIGGASVLASAELGEADDAKRPTVQVGDPFEEKKLLECSLELLERGLLVSLQDLGAAGLTSSASEMASKGEVGIDIDVARVPLREPGMEPFEIMVSESQERMLCVVAPADVPAVLALCEKWEVGGAAIGTVTDTHRMRIFDGERLVGEMPVRALVDECPLYDLQPGAAHGADLRHARGHARARRAPARDAAGAAALAQHRLAPPAVRAVRRDRAVPHGAPPRPGRRRGADVAPGTTGSRKRGRERAPPLKRLRRMGHAPRHRRSRSASTATAAAWRPTPTAARSRRRWSARPTSRAWAPRRWARPTTSTSATPRSRTSPGSCANRCAASATPAARSQAPIVGGNVSLYNEGPAGPIYPTPVVGMVGSLPDAARAGRLGFARAGDAIALVGPFTPSLAASELAKLHGQPLPDGLAEIDLDAVLAAQAAVREAVRAGALTARTTSPRAGSRSRWPSAAWPAPWAQRSR